MSNPHPPIFSCFLSLQADFRAAYSRLNEKKGTPETGLAETTKVKEASERAAAHSLKKSIFRSEAHKFWVK